MVNRRRFLLSASVAVGAAIGCDDGAVTARNEAARLRAKLNTISGEVDELKEAFDDVESKMSDFDDDNWQDVVEELRSLVRDLSEKVDALTGEF